MAVSTRAPRRKGPIIPNWLARQQGVIVIYALLIAVIVVSASIEPDFLGHFNINNLILQVVALGIVSVGQAVTLLIGGIDLSVGSVISLTTALASTLMIHDGDVPLGIAACVGMAVAVALVNTLGIVWLRVAPFIMTLATMTMVQGIALAVLPAPGHPVAAGFTNLSYQQVGPLPLPAIPLIVTVVGAFVVLRVSGFGKHVYATGGNEVVARLSGIRTARIKLAVYLISSLFACLAGLTLTSRMASGDPLVGQPYSLDSVTAAVIGGLSLFGGRGSVMGAFAGAVVLTILSNVLNLQNVSPYYQSILKGAIIIIALSISFGRRGTKE